MRVYRRELKKIEQMVAVEDKAICDKCGREAPDEGYVGTHSLDVNWDRDRSYGRQEVTIAYRHGAHYPEGDSTQAQYTDCCPDCFKKFVMPALEALGFKFHTVESDG
jgi:hypothetical protein